ncbi:MAG: adenosylmethionine decarboxylase [Proteobacteria bacterium]|nr:adenosylmethionine decarboxylase [Pseudomonadota bacterium]MCK4867856.1 adenosylmethionine decarboxylase [Alphaproteobacteria bacterium]
MSDYTALDQLGTDLGRDPGTTHADDVTRSVIPLHADRDSFENDKDFFIERDGVRFAGTHLIIDLWGCEGIDDIDRMDRAMRDCVEAAGATLLHIHLHHFTPNSGVSGVAVLAESHISVHSWPECGYAAFDVFMCGDAQPHKAIDVLKAAFGPSRVKVTEHLRGED